MKIVKAARVMPIFKKLCDSTKNTCWVYSRSPIVHGASAVHGGEKSAAIAKESTDKLITIFEQ